MLEQEWLKIYRETVHPLFGYMAKRTGGNRELTEDIVQESYLRALDHWKLKVAPDSPLAWLKRVSRNILIDYLRHKKWDAKSLSDGHPDTGPRTAEDAFESLEIFLAITSLGRKKARILEAFYYDGMSGGETGGETPASDRPGGGLWGGARQSLKSLLPDSPTDGGKND